MQNFENGIMKEVNLPTNPTICILGCGTMGRAILSGILDGSTTNGETSVSSTKTFTPKKFIACVSGEESAKRITKAFNDKVTLLTGHNVEGVREADIIILW